METTKITGSIYTGSIFKGIDKIVSNDELRPTMNHAFIDQNNIIATDAHCLVKIDLSFFGLDQESINHLNGKCIDKETLQKLGSMKASQQFTINEQGFCLLNKNFKISVIYPLGKMEEIGKYPNYDAVIPEEIKEQSYTSLNAKLFLYIDNVFNNGYHTNGRLKMNFHGVNKAVTLTSECGKFKGLLMPRML